MALCHAVKILVPLQQNSTSIKWSHHTTNMLGMLKSEAEKNHLTTQKYFNHTSLKVVTIMSTIFTLTLQGKKYNSSNLIITLEYITPITTKPF